MIHRHEVYVTKYYNAGSVIVSATELAAAAARVADEGLDAGGGEIGGSTIPAEKVEEF